MSESKDKQDISRFERWWTEYWGYEGRQEDVSESAEAAWNAAISSASSRIDDDPTPAMQQAGVRELRSQYWQGMDFNRVCAIYRAMLAEAPRSAIRPTDPSEK